MRVALLSPYSYTYPGGVGRHCEALAEELLAQGHETTLFAPCDPDDRLARLTHRGARPERRVKADYLCDLGRTLGVPANGAVSNLAPGPSALVRLDRELRRGRYDVLHVHEPPAMPLAWGATENVRLPLVGTFHCYSANRLTNNTAVLMGARRLFDKLHVRIAVSEAASWTARRFYGGRYRVIPNGVDLGVGPSGAQPPPGPLRLLFVGRPEERKGLPVLLSAFEALRTAGIDARLIVAGAAPDEVAPYLLDAEGVEVAGRVSEEEKWRLLDEADVLCAPSLGGESFGMVLTEAFAAGTPAVCSDIAGYRDVARDRVDTLLVPPGRPAELAEALRDLAIDPARRLRMGAAARERAERFAWPTVAGEVLRAYEDAATAAAAVPDRRTGRALRRCGLRPADGAPRARAQRSLASLEPSLPGAGRRRATRIARRVAVTTAVVGGTGLAAVALQRIGLESIGRALLASSPVWVMVAFGLMCASMLARAEAWHAILKAALPGTRVRRTDAARATMIGVLMSATLPARLGEPSRAMIMARRVGLVRERFPLVLGTLVSQTLLNIVALAILGTVMFATVGLFQGNEDALIVASIAPAAMLAAVLALPALLRRGRPSRSVRVQQAVALARATTLRARRGLDVFRRPRLAAWASFAQLGAWAIQWLSCYALLVALGLDERAGLGAAAAVLFAVNVTAILPITPSNLGVFQAACVAVLSAYGVSHTGALAYGIILQAVEIATALTMGMPALVREGMTWKDMRLRALHVTPVELTGHPRRAAEAAEAEF